MLLVREFKAGVIEGVVHTYEKIGDILPMHTHGPDSAHIVIVARGRVKMKTAREVNGIMVPEDEIELKAGACADTPPYVFHEIEALENDSRTYNLVKGVTE